MKKNNGRAEVRVDSIEGLLLAKYRKRVVGRVVRRAYRKACAQDPPTAAKDGNGCCYIMSGSHPDPDGYTSSVAIRTRDRRRRGRSTGPPETLFKYPFPPKKMKVTITVSATYHKRHLFFF